MDISSSLTYSITKTGIVLRQLTARRIKEAGIDLTPEESVLMNQLWDRDNQTLSELNQASLKEASTLTRQIDQLVKKGLVQRTHGTEDRRTVYVALSGSGKRLKKKFSAMRIDYLDRDLVNLSEREANKFIQLLEVMREKAHSELQES